LRRLGTLDRALLALFVPLWLVCFALHVKQWRAGELAWVPVTVAPASDEYPAVSGFWPNSDAAVGALRLGDRVERVGAHELRGAGRLDFLAAVYQAAREDGSVAASVERAGRRVEVRFRLLPVGQSWRLPLMSLGFALPAFLALLQRPGSRSVRAFFLGMLCFGLHWTFFFGGSRLQTGLWAAVFVGSAFLFLPLALQAALSFPESVTGAVRRRFAWTWIFGIFGFGALGWVFGVPFSPTWGVRIASAFNVLGPLALIVVLTRSFRRADPLGRRQLKWILYGFYVGLLPVVVGGLLPTATPRLWWIHELMMTAVVLLPVCVAVALARYNLFDIDRLISATVSYNVLLVLLIGGALLLVPWITAASSDLLGLDPSMGQVAVSVVLAGLALPADRRLRPHIERFFFAERYALERGVEQLLNEIGSCRDAREVTQLIGERLDSLLRPDSCVLYARTAEGFSPVFARGRALAPSLPLASPLLGALARLRGAEVVGALGSGADRSAEWSAFDRAAAEAIGFSLLAPVRRGDELAALLCLGPKRSGDVYTSTDRTLLAALGARHGAVLERFDQAEMLEQARAMQEALRRYVPGAVVEQLASGEQLEPGEVEVSMFFVDIRGYTSFSEGRRAGEIFSTVNRYTETASELVREHGGSIIEFHGDGLLAVFGAPRPLPGKERAAVEAGRAVVCAVEALDSPTGAPLSVGVGIATGVEFTGNVKAVDRVIWTVLGNHTNLAARLEAMTRDLDASIVIDAATRRGAGAAADDFVEHAGTVVRGRSEPFVIYALPLTTAD
jgi:class 3 adenylate cyclase